jgi:hypothetical protein
MYFDVSFWTSQLIIFGQIHTTSSTNYTGLKIKKY